MYSLLETRISIKTNIGKSQILSKVRIGITDFPFASGPSTAWLGSTTVSDSPHSPTSSGFSSGQVHDRLSAL